MLMRCLMCHRPYGSGDVQVTTGAVIYTCRRCGSERHAPRASVRAVYGEEAAKDSRALHDQAKRLEG